MLWPGHLAEDAGVAPGRSLDAGINDRSDQAGRDRFLRDGDVEMAGSAARQSRRLRRRGGSSIVAVSNAAPPLPGTRAASPASDARQSEPQPSGHADPLDRIEMRAKRDHPFRRDAVRMPPILGRQRLDQAKALKPVQGAIEGSGSKPKHCGQPRGSGCRRPRLLLAGGHPRGSPAVGRGMGARVA